MAETINFASEDEVLAYHNTDKENRQIVIFEGKVYDVKDYMPNHPGGPQYISDKLGTNIEEAFEEAEHTKAAKKTLLKLPVVGVIATKAKEAVDPVKSEAASVAKTQESSTIKTKSGEI